MAVSDRFKYSSAAFGASRVTPALISRTISTRRFIIRSSPGPAPITAGAVTMIVSSAEEIFRPEHVMPPLLRRSACHLVAAVRGEQDNGRR